jgi:hypothetical protein
MKHIYPLLIVLFLFSCSDNKKQNLDLISKIETIGIGKFDNITYGKRGDIELYEFYISDDKTCIWSYDNRTNVYELDSLDILELKKQKIGDPKQYSKDLRKQIQNLKIISITQSPWIGNLIRFWISNEEFISYVNPEFKFDDEYKRRWQDELNSGKLIKQNWYYIKL